MVMLTWNSSRVTWVAVHSIRSLLQQPEHRGILLHDGQYMMLGFSFSDTGTDASSGWQPVGSPIDAAATSAIENFLFSISDIWYLMKWFIRKYISLNNYFNVISLYIVLA